MKRLTTILLALTFISIQTAKTQDNGLDAIIKKGATLETITDSFEFTEGVTSDKKGNIYFTDQPSNSILTYNEKKGVSVFLTPAGRSNGMICDKDGNLWSAADEKNEIWKIAPDKTVEKISNSYNGKVYNGPNDFWPDLKGGIYFSDPFFRRTWWDHKDMPQEKQRVYYIKPDHKTIIIVVDDMLQPNGIIGTPDGKVLYIADMRANKTYKYDMNPDGTLSNKTLFCEMGSDGMTIDEKGNIYITGGKGVTVFDKTGAKLGNISIPQSWTSNLCFGGKDMKSLYITASKGLYRMRMNVKGSHY